MSIEFVTLSLAKKYIDEKLEKVIERLPENLQPGEVYSKSEIDAMMGSYITDIDTLIGGDA